MLKYQAQAKKQGYAITLHLDSKTRSQIDEFSTSNFIAIKKRASDDEKPTLVYPKSESILKSVTAKSLMDIARSLGWNVDHRPIPFQEVIDGGLEEVMACGTAAVRSHLVPRPTWLPNLTESFSALQAITPIRSITYLKEDGEQAKVSIGDGQNAGPRTLERAFGLLPLRSTAPLTPSLCLRRAVLQNLTGIQAGNKEGPAGWLWPAEGVDAAKA